MKPEDALPAARAAAVAARAQGGYADDLSRFTIEPTDRISLELLMEWAVIEPDDTELRSTRRLGAPVTWFKRQMQRGLQQYFNQLISQQTRFNIHVIRHVAELEDRVKRLEEHAAAQRRERQG